MSSRSAPRRARTGTARERAADVLVRVETEGAFAAPVLDGALDRTPALSPPDRGLATELVYGVLRTAPALDAQLQRHAPRAGSIAALDAYARSVLRIAAYEILALARVPPRAAVHASVETLKRDRSKGLAGFANALLRKIAAERPEPLPADARAALALSAVPTDVKETLARALGDSESAQSVLRAMFYETPSTGIRLDLRRISRDALISKLTTELPGATVEAGKISPLSVHVSNGGDVRQTPSYREGLFSIQEEGAQCVALAAGVAPGMTVLDACAGRGGKTVALASLMQSRGVLHAAEMYPDKVSRIEDELTRLDLAAPSLAFQSIAVDLTRGLGALTQIAPSDGYDLVLVDAPCSGLGTLARRPDVLFRRSVVTTESDAPIATEPRTALPVLQLAILDRVAPRVRAGGTLLYAVCTLTREEGRDVVTQFVQNHRDFSPIRGSDTVPERLRGEEITLRPDLDATDGFQIFRLQRSANS